MKNSTSPENSASTSNPNFSFKLGNSCSIDFSQSRDTKTQKSSEKELYSIKVDYDREIDKEIRKRIQKHLEE